MQAVAPDREYVPTPHVEQEDCPAIAWNVPAEQLLQLVAFKVFEKVPAEQFAQPRSVVLVGTCDTCVPARQSDHAVQVLAFVVVVYPLAQLSHVCVSALPDPVHADPFSTLPREHAYVPEAPPFPHVMQLPFACL